MADKQIDKYLPKLRFPEFKDEGEWQVMRLGDVVRCFSGGTPSATNKDYYGGDIPFIRSGELHSSKTELYLTRAGLENSSAKMVQKGTILYALYGATSGDVGIARVSGAINQAILAIIPNVIIDKMYLYQYLSYSKDFIINRFLQGGQGNLSASIITSLSIPLPTIQEQKKIASCLSSLDECIASSKTKLEQLQAHKKGLMQKLFPAPGKSLPEYRFPEFINDISWDSKTLGDVTRIVNKRNKSNRSLPIYSINNKRGFVMQSEQFAGIESKSRGYDTSAYKIVTSNLFAYNPARINVGSIGYSGSIKEGLISSLYVCFKTTNSVDDGFLKCFMDSYPFQKAVENNVEGGIRSYLFYDNFSRIHISIPSIEEQRKVASAIASFNQLEELYTKKLSMLEKQKKGLVQVLFPNNR